IINDNAWHHVLFVYYGDGTDGVADRIDAYLDGVEIPYIGNFLTSRLSLSQLIVGASGATGSDGFAGRMDEVAVYDWSALPDEAAVNAAALEIVETHRGAAASQTANYASVVRGHSPL